MAPALEAAGVLLEIRAVGSDLSVRADPEQIEQVLINVVNNAVEALNGRTDGRIALRAQGNPHGGVSIHVADNGPGIDESRLEDIFVPFFTTKRNGTGVGLSLSRQIMRLNRGHIVVKSAPGRGSEFILNFR